MSNAVCIGGPDDAKISPAFGAYPDYRLWQVELGGEQPLFVLVHDTLTTTAAVHMVFAAYAKKGKK